MWSKSLNSKGGDCTCTNVSCNYCFLLCNKVFKPIVCSALMRNGYAWMSFNYTSSKQRHRAIFCWANAGFITFSSKTCSIVPTSNLCQNVQRPKNQLNQSFSATRINYLERTDKNTSTYTTIYQC